MVDFTQLALPFNLVLFAIAALAVLVAGSRLSRYADAISSMTNIGHAALGIILLAGVTSLPEIGVTATASVAGQTNLAINNLFGSIAMQVALLALVDVVVGRRALTAVVPEPVVLLQGSMNVLLLGIAACGMVVGDIQILGIGAWSWICIFGYIGCVWVLSQEEGRKPWLAARAGKPDEALLEETEHRTQDRPPGLNMRSTIYKTIITAIVILAAGFVVAKSGEAIAQQTGLGTSFVGFVLIAVSTSLPEASTALAAARHGHFVMAMSDILGTNLINVGLIFLVDVLSPTGPPLGEVGTFATFGALLGIVLTALFLAGLTERRDRAILRMGYDSLAVMVVYAGGLVLLYTLR